jgi:hypothetical protein
METRDNSMQAIQLLSFAIEREIRLLYKQQLMNFEDLLVQHNITFGKLMDALPKEHPLIVQANYLDEASSAHFRKRILDAGNAALRASQSEIAKFDIKFKTTKQ